MWASIFYFRDKPKDFSDNLEKPDNSPLDDPGTANKLYQPIADPTTVLPTEMAQISRGVPTEAGALLTLLFVAGMLCNVITILVLRRRNSLGTRLLLYFSYVDVAFLPLVYVHTALYVFPKGTNRKISEYLSPFLHPFLFTVFTAESYLISLIAVQRSLILSVPLKFIRFTRDEIFNKSLIGIALFAVMVNIPEWIRYRPELHWNAELNMTLVRRVRTNVFDEKAYDLVKVPVNNILPLALITISTVIMVISRLHSVPRTGQERRERGRNQLTYIVIAVTVLSIILDMTVTCIFWVLRLNVTASEDTFIHLDIMLTAILFSNSLVNFSVYCAIGPGFRQTLISLFRRNTGHACLGKALELQEVEPHTEKVITSQQAKNQYV